jgi:hypothetical protein
MKEIIADNTVGANFVVLLVVKLGAAQSLIGTAHTYLPGGMHEESEVVIQRLLDCGSRK